MKILNNGKKKAFRSIKEKIALAATPEQIEEHRRESNDKTMANLLTESISTIRCMTGELPYSTALIKGALERKIMNFAKYEPELALRIINEINLMSKKECNKDVFTSRHKIFKAIESIKEQISKPQEVKETKRLFKNEDLEVINNFEVERIQFLFKEKPEENVRKLLKSNGFKWSPRFTAWQRKNTFNGMYVTKQVLNQLQFKVEI